MVAMVKVNQAPSKRHQYPKHLAQQDQTGELAKSIYSDITTETTVEHSGKHGRSAGKVAMFKLLK